MRPVRTQALATPFTKVGLRVRCAHMAFAKVNIKMNKDLQLLFWWATAPESEANKWPTFACLGVALAKTGKGGDER